MSMTDFNIPCWNPHSEHSCSQNFAYLYCTQFQFVPGYFLLLHPTPNYLVVYKMSQL